MCDPFYGDIAYSYITDEIVIAGVEVKVLVNS